MKKGKAKDLKCWDASKLEHWLCMNHISGYVIALHRAGVNTA
jgi:hypothetical protein